MALHFLHSSAPTAGAETSVRRSSNLGDLPVLNSLVLPYLGNIDNGLGGVGRGTLAKRVSLPQREIKLWQVTKKSPFVPLLSTLRGKKKKLNFDSDT